MDFKQIEAFVSVIKYRSFSKAADVSFLTQPTISARVSTLEKELGVTLIDRMGKESRPTKIGRLFYKYALDMINTREKAYLKIRKESQDISGIIELQASSVPGQYMVPQLISDFYKVHNGVRFYVELSDSEKACENILNQKGELGFVGISNNKAFTYYLLYKDKCKLITPKTKKYIEMWNNRHSLAMCDFNEVPLIWREDGSATRELFEREYYCYYGTKVNVVATINSLNGIKQAVAAGLGVSIVPSIAAADIINNNDILTFDLEDKHLDREFYLIHRKDTVLSPAANEFKHFILKSFEA